MDFIKYSDVLIDILKYYVSPLDEIIKISDQSKIGLLRTIKTQLNSFEENDIMDKITCYINNAEIGKEKRINDLWDIIHLHHKRLNLFGFKYIYNHSPGNEIWGKIGNKYNFENENYLLLDNCYLKDVIQETKNMFRSCQYKPEGIGKLYFFIMFDYDEVIEIVYFLDKMFWNLKEHIKQVYKIVIAEQQINLNEKPLFGLNAGLNPLQIKFLFDRLYSNKFIDCELTDFKKIFEPKQLHDFKKIEWKHKYERKPNLGKAHKASIKLFFEFLRDLSDKRIKANSETINNYFSDTKGKYINISTRRVKGSKGNNEQWWYKAIELIFKELPN